ncbi:MAG: hypothetical protein ABMA64_18235 [Myxococcota bacterium]
MAEVEQQIVDAGAQIIWVLEQDPSVQPGTAELCDEVMDELGSDGIGLCVGDAETEPVAGTFDDSPFSEFRGFDMVLPRATMEILWTSSHGTPTGNDNLDGEVVLDIVEQVVAGAR